jgi:23S rRNA pseudouridine1911/1915/1917 synthase
LNNKIESWIVGPEGARIRLDQFLVGRIFGESRSQIQNWIRKGYLRVNGEQVKTGYRTKLDDRIEMAVPESLPDQPLPEHIPLEILYEDAELAVINKPAGLVCHTGAGVRSGTLVNALLHHMGPLETGDPQRPGIVHRLDKFTSGVMLVAKNKSAHRQLAQQFKSREVKKEYLAMVYGRPSPDSGTIDLPLGRDTKDRKKISTRARRKRIAITHYSLEKNYGPVCLLSIRIDTGRTHQIRVHLAHKGHPIVGDSIYGGNRARNLQGRILEAAREMQRPFLHSRRIQFRHPTSEELLSFTAPLPLELERFLAVVRG